MPTVVLAWELGAGFGHVAHLVPVASALKGVGYRVVAALSNVSRGGPPLADVGVDVYPCPVEEYRPSQGIFPTRTYAHVLHDVGFENEDALFARVKAWRSFYEDVEAEFVVCDHSPTALLAAQISGLKHAVFGTGFFCPPSSAFRAWPVPSPPGEHREVAQDSQSVLQNANAVIARQGGKPLQSLEHLYGQADQTFLVTVEELDHFPDRQNAEYLGILRTIAGEAAEWPAARVVRVFGYLKDFPALRYLVASLRAGPFSTLLFTDAVPPNVLQFIAADNLRVLKRPANMIQVAAECDVGITNGNHGTICDLLLAGRPVLMIPLTAEQYLLARRVEANGLGLLAAANDIDEINASLLRLIEDSSFRSAATAFQRRYAHLDSGAIARRIAQKIEDQLSG